MRFKWLLYDIKKRIQNYRLVKKYPWLHPTAWSKDSNGEYEEVRDPNYKYEYIRLFTDMPGWWKAFGKIFCDEIQEEFHNCPDLYVLEEKEKWGGLRISFANANKKIMDICDKFEQISHNICFFCGCEAPMTNSGYYLPMCKKCYEEHRWGTKPYSQVVCEGDSGKLPDYYTVRYCRDGITEDAIINISKTVKKIRGNYAKNR